jgi:hypothetical protein
MDEQQMSQPQSAVGVKREGRHVADPQSGTAVRRPSPRLDTL